MHFSKIVLVGWIVFLVPFSSFCQEDATSRELSSMVVVETRSPQLLSQVSPWVTIISSEELKQRQIYFVVDALRTVPGLAVVRSGQVGGQTSLFSRGAESNQVTFLLDGRKLNGGFSGQYNLGHLGMGGFSGLEVLRGSASTLYGSEGAGGAVMLRSGQLPRQGVASSVGFSGGAYGTFRGDLQTTFRDQAWSGNLGVSSATTENDRPNADYQNVFGSFKLARALPDGWSVDLVGMGYDVDMGVPGSLSFPSFSDSQQNEQFLLSPGVSGGGDHWSMQFIYSYSSDEIVNAIGGNRETDVLHGDQVDALWTWDVMDALSLTVGGNYYEQHFKREGGAVDNGLNNLAGFGLLAFSFAEGSEVTAGFRQEDYSIYGGQTTGTVFARQNLVDGVALFGRYAESFAVPTGNDLWGWGGNVNLKPEEIKSWEVGFRFGKDGFSRGSVSYFSSKYENLVEFWDPDGDWIGIMKNIDKAETEGLELSLLWTVTKAWQVRSAYTYLDARKDDGSRLARRPRHAFSVAVDYQGEKAIGGFEWLSVSDRVDFGLAEGEDYLVARLYGSYELSSSLNIFGRVENLFDEEYEEVDGFPALGIGVFGGLRYSF
jgi:vitamin B12 transporter